VSRFRIVHPHRSEIYAVAGVDHAVGMFVEVHREGRSRPFKSLDFFTLGRSVTLNDCFEFSIENEFFTREQLEAALVWLQDGSPTPRDMRVLGIITEMKPAD
jgi:hypothetical protein